MRMRRIFVIGSVVAAAGLGMGRKSGPERA